MNRDQPPGAKSSPLPPTEDEATSEAQTVSSAAGVAKNPAKTTSGRWSVAQLRLSEARAREILSQHFSAYGANIQADYSFHEGSLLCTLDGYDPDIRVGYSFISHDDEDVVTDLDEDGERALQVMADQGRCYVLVVHDHQVHSADKLAEVAESFLAGLPPSDQLRS